MKISVVPSLLLCFQAKMQEMPPPAWELEKQQYVTQLSLLADKVRAETNTRIEAEVKRKGERERERERLV